MPDKISSAEYLRQWRLKNPEKRKAHDDKRNALKRRIRSRIKAIGASHLENSLGPLVQPTQKHVVLSRLLRRLLLEAWNKSYLSSDKTSDDTEYESRVKAALDVSRCLADEYSHTGVDDPL